MRDRPLTREKALEEYLIYRRRVREFLDVYQILTDISSGKYVPKDVAGRGPDRQREVALSVVAGFFASLIDAHGSALNIFDVWITLFPHRAEKVKDVWATIKPAVGIIRDYRNEVVFHANKNVARYLNTLITFRRRSEEVGIVMKAFAGLAVELISEEGTVLPDLRSEADSILRRAARGIAAPPNMEFDIEKAQDYFLEGV